jgi:glycosyltransferase involved in cell wall biosynthesis
MNRKKLLIVATLPPPIHGANIINKYIAESDGLRDIFEVHVFQMQYASSIENLGKISLKKLLGIIKYVLCLVVVLFRFRPDVVYFVPMISGLAFYRDCLFAFMFKLFNIKTIYHLHGKGIHKAIQQTFNLITYRWFFYGASVITLSEKLFDDISSLVKRDNVFFLPNAIEYHAGDASDSFNRKENGSFQILFVSNLMSTKGPLVLLDACKELKNRNVSFKAKFIGGERLDLTKEEFLQAISRNNLSEQVSYLGSLYGPEKDAVFSSSDVFVLPTTNDCFPLVIIEAMAHGLPVISTDEGAIPEMILNNVTGFIVDKNNPAAIADKIETLIYDKFLHQQMSKNAKKRYFEKYTLDVFEENLVKIFASISSNLK